MKFPPMRSTYDMVVAIAEKSAGNEQVGDQWFETKSFNKDTPIKDIVAWADNKSCSGKLIITIDEDSIRAKTDKELKDEGDLPF